MTVFMTKVWGFGEPVGPLQFSSQGWRERALSMLKPGDTVALVGTLGDNTQEHEQNRILGLMEPTRERVSALDYLVPAGPQDLTDSGEYKWPFGLLNRAAWRFDEPRTRLSEISDRYFSMDSAQGIVPLTAEEGKKILALPRTLSPLLTTLRTIARTEGEDVARRRGAPPPTQNVRNSIMQMRRAPAYTYALTVGDPRQRAFKIGWAFDWKARMRGFNQAAMPDLGGVRYSGFLSELWSTAMDAFRMEQSILRRFDSNRHRANREIISGVDRLDLELAWAKLVGRRAK